MASHSMFQMVNERGWRAGLSNLTRKENRDWWGTRTWLLQSLIWLVILNGLTLGVILITSDPTSWASADPHTANLLADRTTIPLSKFFQIAGIALTLGIVVLAQDEIIGEKRSGTAAWILSKPVSRSAFVLSKLLGNLPGILVTQVLLQGAVCYAMVSISRGSALPVIGFLGGLGAVLLALLFYLTLTLMLGTLFNSRGAVMGIPLVIILGFPFFPMLLPSSFEFLPYGLTMSAGETPSVALALALGQPIPSLTPVIANVAWIVLFVAVAIWRFQHEEL